MQDTERASVKPQSRLWLLCVGCISPHSLQNRTFDTDNPLPDQVTNAADQKLSWKRKNSVSKESLAQLAGLEYYS